MVSGYELASTSIGGRSRDRQQSQMDAYTVWSQSITKALRLYEAAGYEVAYCKISRRDGMV